MSKSVAKAWFVYMVRCSDHSLYTGITIDIERRFQEHVTGKGGAKYTRARTPVEVVYHQKMKNRSEASRREWELKQLSKSKKQLLIDKT